MIFVGTDYYNSKLTFVSEFCLFCHLFIDFWLIMSIFAVRKRYYPVKESISSRHWVVPFSRLDTFKYVGGFFIPLFEDCLKFF